MSIYSINTYELPKEMVNIYQEKNAKRMKIVRQIQAGPIVSVLYAKAQHNHTTPIYKISNKHKNTSFLI